MCSSHIYKTLDSVLNVLNKHENSYLPEVKELISIYQNKVNLETKDATERKPLIVFEGFDGSGKSTIIKVLCEKMSDKTQMYATPPNSIKHLRENFDTKPPELRRAYYSLGNYIAALELNDILKENVVLMDRFWHSTCAAALANNVTDLVNIPEEESDIYNWPEDLIKPDLIIFLAVPENLRIQRLSRRVNYTAEEDRLKNDNEYRNILYNSFFRMKNPGVVKVMSIKPPKKVADKVLTLFNEKDLI